MSRRLKVWICALSLVSLWPAAVLAQETEPTASTSAISCASEPGARTHCPADTSAGVVLARSTGAAECLLGKTWGYDDASIWVSDGCSGEFVVGETAAAGALTPSSPPPSAAPPPESEETWGFLEPGNGFLVGKSGIGTLSISGYALVRYMNQLPAEQTFTDHLGEEHPVDTRHDIYSHRVLVWLKGWMGLPKLVYTIAFWTVTETDQDAIFGNIGYRFDRRFNLYAGINANPGSRSLQGSHPYWLGHDRVMADEFFRPFFSQGVWANGEVLPGLWYTAMVSNSSSTLGNTSAQLDRNFTTGASVWWMPTTKEFGPRGAYGDWEMHEEVATRFGVSVTQSPEERYTEIGTNPGNTALKLADSLNLFSTGSLAPGVTITNADYRIFAFDAGLKYRGVFVQTELYSRRLDGFVADGPLPVEVIDDWGFYVQGSFYPVPKKLELYAATSQIFGDKDAGFENSSEYLAGMNFYPADTRNHRLNVQVIDVNRSPVSSAFGYYIGGQTGTTLSVAFSVFF